MEISLEPISVMYVESPNGPEGAGEAFNKLQAGFASLKGRKFYATFQYPDGAYRACVAIEQSDERAAATPAPSWRTGATARGRYRMNSIS